MSDNYRNHLQSIPGADKLWDESLPDAIDIDRLVRLTEATVPPPFPPPSTLIREKIRQAPLPRTQAHNDVIRGRQWPQELTNTSAQQVAMSGQLVPRGTSDPPFHYGGSQVQANASDGYTLRQRQQHNSIYAQALSEGHTPTPPPESLREMIPNIDELWDPRLPFCLNISRMVSGDTTPLPPPRQPDPFDSLITGFANDLRLSAEAEANEDDMFNADFEDIVSALRKPATDSLQSPLLALQQQVASVFKHGPLRAGGVFESLYEAARSGVTTAKTPLGDWPVPWNSCKAAATLVGLLASPVKRLFEVAKFQSESLGGLPTYEEIHNDPSTSLLKNFQHAKALARGEHGASSVLVVSLIDVEIFELARRGTSRGFTSFAHTFVLGIGPEGVIIWQGWGEHGYGLNQWIKNGDARVRTWQEAGDFVDVFEKFVAYKVSRLSKSPIRVKDSGDTNSDRRASGMRSGTSYTRSASTLTSSRSAEVRGHRGRLFRRHSLGCGCW
jgi:hypothetical protein